MLVCSEPKPVRIDKFDSFLEGNSPKFAFASSGRSPPRSTLQAGSSRFADGLTNFGEQNVELIKRLFLCTAAACSISVAHATPMTWVDTIELDRYIMPFSSTDYTHDIRDEGYTPLVDSISSYSLTVNLYDDGDDKLEVALIDAPGLLGDRIFFDLSGEEFGGWSLVGYTQLALTGLYDVTVSSWYGDFFLADSTLTVRGDEHSGQRSVPEPGALGLLGLALLGLTLVSRRKPRMR
jgi:hypothetical protein